MRLCENHAFSKYDFALSLNNISDDYANSEDFQVLAITTMVSSFVAEWYGEVRSGIMNEG